MATRAARGPGRRPRLPADEERRLLLDAAMRALRANEYTDAPIAEILEEAGLSTRSFYRHFESKDELLLALHRRDADLLARRLERRVGAATTPTEALRAWIDEILRVRTDRRRSERAALLSSEGVRRAAGFAREVTYALHLTAESLRAVLDAGRADGSFPLADPARDAELIQAIVWPRTRDTPDASSSGVTVDHIFGFCLRALGAG